MTVELALSTGTLIALLGHFIRAENRLTKLETKIDFLINGRK